MNAWLTLIGTPANGVAGLTPEALAALEMAEIIVLPQRLMSDALPEDAEIHAWPSPLSDIFPKLEGWCGRNVVILATGDPLHYGVGATLLKHVPHEEMRIIPSPSAFSLAAARLGWPLQNVEMISLHGRSVSTLSAFLYPGARIITLTANAQTINEAADLLSVQGFGGSRLTILQNMGGDVEAVVQCNVGDARRKKFSDFNTLAIDCVADNPDACLPQVPGLPDDAFVHDGQLTKREVRAATMSALMPHPGAMLWDVGAGCGSVAIEWMRSCRNAQAIAFERNAKRMEMIQGNANNLGAPSLEIISGDVPKTLKGQPVPDAIFMGGAVADETVFKACLDALKPGGRLVINGVTLEGHGALMQRFKAHGGDLVRIDVSHLDDVGGLHAMRPRMSVLQYRLVKP
ncbi:MAG: precorrin-6y C5,15-methyltransferase (decarboxylating) subunit CbiE [Hyphomicrobiales bacterium]